MISNFSGRDLFLHSIPFSVSIRLFFRRYSLVKQNHHSVGLVSHINHHWISLPVAKVRTTQDDVSCFHQIVMNIFFENPTNERASSRHHDIPDCFSKDRKEQVSFPLESSTIHAVLVSFLSKYHLFQRYE